MKYIFVYGTLKKDQTASWSNALKDQEFISNGILNGYVMYKILNSYPGIKKGNGKISGEVYKINDNLLEQLDKIECVDQNLYQRIEETIILDNGKTIHAQVYVYQQEVLDEDLMLGPIFKW